MAVQNCPVTCSGHGRLCPPYNKPPFHVVLCSRFRPSRDLELQSTGMVALGAPPLCAGSVCSYFIESSFWMWPACSSSAHRMFLPLRRRDPSMLLIIWWLSMG